MKNSVTWDTTANIHVFIIGKHTLIGNGSTSTGIASPENATCWIMGRKYGSYQTAGDFLETLGHEIGHIFFGEGHPDGDISEGQGVAPLSGTDHTKRLMCSGMQSTPNSRLTVKPEWDKAEAWMAKEEAERPMNP